MIDALAENLSFLNLKFSRNKLTHTVAAADPALVSRVGLKYLLTLLVPEYPFSANFEELHTSEGREAPVEGGGVQVFAGAEFRYNAGRNGKLDGLLSYEKPRYRQSAIGVLLTQTTSYCLREEVQGGEPAVETSVTGAKLYAIKAGLANEDMYAFGENFWKTWQADARQFLTWQPDYKRVRVEQEEYLHFLVNFTPTPGALRLRVRLLGANGTGTAVTAMSIANPLLYSVLGIPVGLSSLGLAAPLGDVVAYEVWLANETNGRVSEVRHYVIDRTYEPYDRALLFVNSLGGWDTMRLTGQAQQSLKVAQNTAEVERPARAGADFSEMKIVSIEGEREISISTGYFRRHAADYLKYLDELLLSEQVYLITDKGHRPLQLTTTSLVDQYDDVELIARTFSFRILDTVENYSNLPAAEPTPERLTTWRGKNMRQILNSFGKRTGMLVFQRLEKVYVDDNSAVIPYTLKLNSQGDPDYLDPITDSDIAAGSTPYPSVALSRPGTYQRNNCAVTHLGGPATITIAAGRWGGEQPGEADALAEGEYASKNTQALANASGTCTINDKPLYLAVFHKIPMTDDIKVVGSADYGPVVALRINSAEVVSNTVGKTPLVLKKSDNKIAPGTYNLVARVQYVTNPMRPCKLRIPSKNREIAVTTSGYYAFDNLVINSSDDPLTIEVVL